jgi:succinyl-diaminopimelate desuccinylase
MKARIDKWFEEHSEKLIADVVRLIGVKSVLEPPESGAPYGWGARFALLHARDIIDSLRIETAVFEDSMIEGDVRGADGQDAELGILVHVDTVDANAAEWASDPFTADIRDGRIYGRGATDNKGPAVAAMYALACARDVTGGLAKGVRILVGSAEEIGCVDIARWLEVNTPPRYVFSPDADYPLANVEKGRFVMGFRKSFGESADLPRVTSIRGGGTSNIIPGAARATVEGMSKSALYGYAREFSEKTGAVISVVPTAAGAVIRAEGTAAHASQPESGNNAQTALLAMLAALPLAPSDSTDAIRALATLFPHGDTRGEALGLAMADEVSGELTLSFDVFELDSSGFTANFDSRTPQVADTRDILGTVTAALARAGIDAAEHTMTRCHVAAADSVLVRTLLGIYKDYTGAEDAAPLALGGTTYVHGIPGGVAFGTVFPGEDNRIHGRDEYIGIEELLLSAKMFAAAIIELCQRDGIISSQ